MTIPDEKTFAERLQTLFDSAQENNEEIAVSSLHDMVPTFVTPEEFNSRAMQKQENHCVKTI